MTNAPYPLDQPRLTTDVHKILANYGVCFDGAEFLLMEEMFYPQQELFFIASVTPEAVRRSKNKVLTTFTLGKTPHGSIVELRLTFMDRQTDPTSVSTFINPAAPGGPEWLGRLSRQECYNVQMFNKDSGEKIKMTRFPLDKDQRQALKQMCELAKDLPPSSGKEWEACLAFYKEDTGPASGYVRLAPHQRGPKYARNDPCFCGSGIKFKKCCGR